MLKKERYAAFINYFNESQPDAETELNYHNPYELLVAVILSAQCTDKRVNMITPALFERFPKVEIMAASSVEEIFTYIKSISYPNNKAKHLYGMANMLVKDFGGEVPQTVEQLQKLPGVGRKTANVIVSVVYKVPAMAVDTHVYRVSRRLGLTSGKTTLAVEKDLVKHIPKDLVHVAHHWLILHGRYVCIARKPKCKACSLKVFCKHFEKSHLMLMTE